MNFDFYDIKIKIKLKEEMNCELNEAVENFIECGIKEEELGVYVLAFLRKTVFWGELSDAGYEAISSGNIKIDFSENCNKFGNDDTGLNLTVETKMFIVNCCCVVREYLNGKDLWSFHEDVLRDYYYQNLNENSDFRTKKELEELGILVDVYSEKESSGFVSSWYTLSLNKLREIMDKINFLDELDLAK